MLYLIAAHDAGGAEIVSSWLIHQMGVTPWFLLEGPATAVFRRKCGNIVVRTREETYADMGRFDRVLTGTGRGLVSDVETSVIEASKKNNVPVCAYLDHWVGYLERFNRQGRLILPDEIWVCDRFAEDLAKKCFREFSIPIRIEPNRYFTDIAEEVAKFRSAMPKRHTEAIRILYLADTAEPHVIGYTEYEALEGYLQHLIDKKTRVEEIRIRLHPNEHAGKYSDLILNFSGLFSITECENGHAPLAKDLAWADWVVGCDTAALVVGLHAGKKVSSCIPADGMPMTLPFPQIERIFPPAGGANR